MKCFIRKFTAPALLLCLVLGACAGPGGGGHPGPEGEGGPGGSGRPNMAGARGGNGGGISGGMAGMMDQIQFQLADLARELALTPSQTVLWDTYRDRISALMADLLRPEAVRSAAQNAPQQIQAKVAIVRNRLTALEDIGEAADKLYASLDAGQRKVADQRLAQLLPPLYAGASQGLMEGGSRSEAPGGGRSGRRRGPEGGPGGMGGGFGGGMGGGMGR